MDEIRKKVGGRFLYENTTEEMIRFEVGSLGERFIAIGSEYDNIDEIYFYVALHIFVDYVGQYHKATADCSFEFELSTWVDDEQLECYDNPFKGKSIQIGKDDLTLSQAKKEVDRCFLKLEKMRAEFKEYL